MDSGFQLTLTVNGDQKRFAAELTIAGLLAELGLERRKVAVERNLEIVPRSQYDRVSLCSGDALEIVQFVGGG